MGFEAVPFRVGLDAGSKIHLRRELSFSENKEGEPPDWRCQILPSPQPCDAAVAVISVFQGSHTRFGAYTTRPGAISVN